MSQQHEPPTKPSRLMIFVRFCLWALVIYLMLAGLFFHGLLYVFREPIIQTFDWLDTSDNPWESLEVAIPEEQLSFTYWRRHNHPYLAEYELKLALPDGREVELQPETGARLHVKVYALPNAGDGAPQVLLLDRVYSHLVNLKSGECVQSWYAHSDEHPGARYLGRIDGRESPWRFVPASESPEEPLRDDEVHPVEATILAPGE